MSVDTPWEDLPPRVRRAFLDGMGDQKISVDYQKLDGRRSQWDTKFSGVRNILYERYTETTNENTKARLEKYIREEPCSSCHGARLRPEMLAVTVGGKSIYEVCCLSCRESLEFLRAWNSPSANSLSAGASSRKSWSACVFWSMSDSTI